MSELTSKNEISSSVEATFSNRGLDPDCRIVETAVDDDQPSICHETHKIDPDARVGTPAVAFKGFVNVDKISDVQFGGTCWAEAIQKAVQLVKGDKTGELNNLSSEIIARVFRDPKKWDAVEDKSTKWAVEQWNIPQTRYPDMLKEFGVDAENKRFSLNELQETLADNQPVMISGDVKYLSDIDIYKGHEGGRHVLLAIDYEPDTGRYVLLDSNSPTIHKVSANALEKFATGSWNDKMVDLTVGNMTVIKTPAKWSDFRIYEDGRWRMFVDGEEVKSHFVSFDEFINNLSKKEG